MIYKASPFFLALVAGLWVYALLKGASPYAELRRGIFEHLTVITRCGLPVGPGLRALADERAAGGKLFKASREAEVIRGLASRFEAGGSLARAFEGAPRRILAPAQLELLSVSERHGALPNALDLLCKEEVQRVGTRLAEWLAYPLAVAAVVIPVSLFQSSVILPKLQEIQGSMGIEPGSSLVPLSTAALVVALLLLATVLYGLDGWSLPRRLSSAFCGLSDLVLRGAPFRQRRRGRWLTRIGALLRAGATLPEALEATAGLQDVGERALTEAARQAREGQPLEVVLGTAFAQDAPRMLPRALLSVERHGSLGLGLEAAGQWEQDRADQVLRGAGEMLKPLPVVLCGLVVAIHCHAVWGAIVSLQEAVVRSAL